MNVMSGYMTAGLQLHVTFTGQPGFRREMSEEMNID